MPDRTVIFADGNSWYHSLHGLGLTRLTRLIRLDVTWFRDCYR